MPQNTMYKGLEACHVNRLIDFANFLFLIETEPSRFFGL